MTPKVNAGGGSIMVFIFSERLFAKGTIMYLHNLKYS